jgi:hypothetical protein
MDVAKAWTQQIAAALGNGWSAIDGGDRYTQSLAHADGRKLFVDCYDGRAALCGIDATGMRIEHIEITVSTTRNLKAVAADITRRLIDPYTPIYAESVLRKQNEDDAEAALIAVTRRVEEAFGVEGRDSSREIGAVYPGHGSIGIRRKSTGEHVAHVDLREVPLDVVLKLGELLREKRKGH